MNVNYTCNVIGCKSFLVNGQDILPYLTGDTKNFKIEIRSDNMKNSTMVTGGASMTIDELSRGGAQEQISEYVRDNPYSAMLYR